MDVTKAHQWKPSVGGPSPGISEEEEMIGWIKQLLIHVRYNFKGTQS